MSSIFKIHRIIFLMMVYLCAMQMLSAAQSYEGSLLTGELLYMGVPFVLYCAVYKGNLKQRLLMNKPSRATVIRSVLVAIVAQPLLILIGQWATVFFNNPFGDFLSEIQSVSPFVLVYGLVIMPAIFEELVFRGMLLENYKELSPLKAAVLSGFIFGMFHLNMYQFSFAFVLGIVLTYAVLGSRSIIASMIIHGFTNLLSVVMALQSKQVWMKTLDQMVAQSTTSTTGIVAGCAVMVASIVGLVLLMFPWIKEAKKHQIPSEKTSVVIPVQLDWGLLGMELIFGMFAFLLAMMPSA